MKIEKKKYKRDNKKEFGTKRSYSNRKSKDMPETKEKKRSYPPNFDVKELND